MCFILYDDWILRKRTVRKTQKDSFVGHTRDTVGIIIHIILLYYIKARRLSCAVKINKCFDHWNLLFFILFLSQFLDCYIFEFIIKNLSCTFSTYNMHSSFTIIDYLPSSRNVQ